MESDKLPKSLDDGDQDIQAKRIKVVEAMLKKKKIHEALEGTFVWWLCSGVL